MEHHNGETKAQVTLMKVPHPIPYQGSKRKLAKYILAYFPQDVGTLIEPFAGSAAVTIAAAALGKASRFHINDLNAPLMMLWDEMINNPQGLSEKYAHLWTEQQNNAREYYYHIRDKFNRTHLPEYLLYLLARCVKASVRYNPRGEFNQSPDNRRLGRQPKRMSEDIRAVSNLLRGRIAITSKDYRDALLVAKRRDLVYMDPPYQGVCGSGDPRYYGGIDFDKFIHSLMELNERGISFILSYDGRTETKTYGEKLPEQLGMRWIEVNAGRSTQATLLGRNATTYESLYLSKALVSRLGPDIQDIEMNLSKSYHPQLELFPTSGKKTLCLRKHPVTRLNSY